MAIYILLIDTSTPVCSVALSRDGVSIAEAVADGVNVHASHLTTLIDGLMGTQGLEYSDLSAVAIAKGPGSYTGLRIGVSTAKGLCFAADLPLIAIDSLRMLAEGFQQTPIFQLSSEVLLCPMIDARRMEVYQAIYDADLNLILPTTASVIDQHFFDDLITDQEIYLFGSGADKFEQLFDGHPQIHVVPGIKASASAVSHLAYQAYGRQDFVDAAYFEPFYLKDFIPTNPRKLI